MHKEVREIPLVRRLLRNITFEVAKAPNSSLIHKISEIQNSQILIFWSYRRPCYQPHVAIMQQNWIGIQDGLTPLGAMT